MAQTSKSTIHGIVDKTNLRIVIITAGAAFLSVFFLVASISLFSQLRYQSKIISGKETAVKQLKADIAASDNLVSSYQTFVASNPNLIGGNPSGSGPQDGGNAKIVLDALPSKYDFPALTTSIEKILGDQHVAIQSITGNDDEVAQSGNDTAGKPTPVEMPFETSVLGDYNTIQNVITVLQRSIRPIQVQTLHISGDQSKLTLDVTAKTFYQPEKTLNIQKQVVK